MKHHLSRERRTAQMDVYNQMLGHSIKLFDASVVALLDMYCPKEVRDILLKKIAEIEKKPDFETAGPALPRPFAN